MLGMISISKTDRSRLFGFSFIVMNIFRILIGNICTWGALVYSFG